MIDLTRIHGVYLASGYTDLRKSIDGYAAIVSGEYHLNPFSDSLFLFCNRQRNKIKMIYWDGSGFWLLYKRLEQKHFKWPKNSNQQAMVITHQQLSWLLGGLHVHQKTAFKRIKNVIL